MGSSWQTIWEQAKGEKTKIILLAIPMWSLEIAFLLNAIYVIAVSICSFIMLVEAVLDAKYYKLYHKLSLLLWILGLCFNLLMQYMDIKAAGLGGMEGSLCFGGLMLIIFVVSRGGLGFGDVCYAAAIGMFLGAERSVTAFILTFLLGMLTALKEYAVSYVYSKRPNTKIPLGPFLLCGSLISILWGEEAVAWYLNML